MQIFSTSIIELAVISALVSLFLDFCFREGNIFEGWLDFLADMHIPAEAMDLDREERFKEAEKWFWFKPLGGCVICMNVWISLKILIKNHAMPFYSIQHLIRAFGIEWR